MSIAKFSRQYRRSQRLCGTVVVLQTLMIAVLLGSPGACGKYGGTVLRLPSLSLSLSLAILFSLIGSCDVPYLSTCDYV